MAIDWETAVPAEYRIELSRDGAKWVSVFTGEAKPGRTTASLPNIHASRVRIVMSKPLTEWGYSIHQVEVFSAKTPLPKR